MNHSTMYFMDEAGDLDDETLRVLSDRAVRRARLEACGRTISSPVGELMVSDVFGNPRVSKLTRRLAKAARAEALVAKRIDALRRRHDPTGFKAFMAEQARLAQLMAVNEVASAATVTNDSGQLNVPELTYDEYTGGITATDNPPMVVTPVAVPEGDVVIHTPNMVCLDPNCTLPHGNDAATLRG